MNKKFEELSFENLLSTQELLIHKLTEVTKETMRREDIFIDASESLQNKEKVEVLRASRERNTFLLKVLEDLFEIRNNQ
ncbi:MAG: hypothetical protein UU22_C0037G0007 [Parcubacteria group bacterium GW2011_GWA2_40_8]|nr:MAG: hypothetical protein UU22_C0037G0007 [Parcubacteria group bacterium GW2011_GWA2_40_8]